MDMESEPSLGQKIILTVRGTDDERQKLSRSADMVHLSGNAYARLRLGLSQPEDVDGGGDFVELRQALIAAKSDALLNCKRVNDGRETVTRAVARLKRIDDRLDDALIKIGGMSDRAQTVEQIRDLRTLRSDIATAASLAREALDVAREAAASLAGD